MNEQVIEKRLDALDIVDRTDTDTKSPEANTDTFADKAPVDTAFIHETPLVGTDVAVGAVDEIIIHNSPISKVIPPARLIGENVQSSTALLEREESEHFRTRWNDIQGKFVDEPRFAVLEADALVSEVVAQITQMFTNEHNSLEAQWNQGDDVSTEDLRQALQHYRSFFNRLVV